MKSEKLHRWLTLGANLGVLIGILLLVMELNQNLTTMRAQTRNEMSAEVVDLLTLLAENEGLASLRRRGDAGEELSSDERYRYEAFTRAFFRYWENVHYQFSQRLYDEEEFSKQREAWRGHAGRSPGVVGWWCMHRTEFSPDFMAEYDNLLTAHTCD